VGVRTAETGTPEIPISFAGADYAAGRPVRATYTFNSYRLTYRYSIRNAPRTAAWIGFITATASMVASLNSSVAGVGVAMLVGGGPADDIGLALYQRVAGSGREECERADALGW